MSTAVVRSGCHMPQGPLHGVSPATLGRQGKGPKEKAWWRKVCPEEMLTLSAVQTAVRPLDQTPRT